MGNLFICLLHNAKNPQIFSLWLSLKYENTDIPQSCQVLYSVSISGIIFLYLKMTTTFRNKFYTVLHRIRTFRVQNLVKDKKDDI